MPEKEEAPGKIIAIEEMEGPFKASFQRVMRMVPDKDKQDKNLQRLIAFRLKIDGEAGVTEYLIKKIRDAVKCAYAGKLYEFLKNDSKFNECRDGDPPDVA